jgi:hypothetical protein
VNLLEERAQVSMTARSPQANTRTMFMVLLSIAKDGIHLFQEKNVPGLTKRISKACPENRGVTYLLKVRWIVPPLIK